MFVLGVAFALVFIIARWLTAGSDGSSDDTDTAAQAGSGVSATQTVTAGEGADGKAGTDGTSATGDADGKGGKGSTDGTDGTGGTPTGPVGPTTPTLAAPQGTCEASDVIVTPSVAEGAVAGRDVPLRLSLQTRTSEACTWKIAPSTLTVRIAQDGTSVWTTRQCPRAVTRQSVVVRRQVATVVQLTWKEARESTDGCTNRGDWVGPGEFSIAAAALGGEPAEAEFRLGKPTAETIRVTPTPPDPDATRKPKKSKTPVN
ncbi:Putative exported protein [Pimelobacter simplex]|uniref:Putative exported protein n=1 Tax=Nocardioides simplex TaxID=2045 RepID=A0A0A1DHR7_NOCSI|nr:Putative exported protein [Pimelobacter simplex]GEB12299.1 hypothetical protein NSI01_06140 [Pimelobacter simplex]SFM96948.1 hypothetical protein SAMN05421671_4432 [Pimelobacter simplex]